MQILSHSASEDKPLQERGVVLAAEAVYAVCRLRRATFINPKPARNMANVPGSGTATTWNVNEALSRVILAEEKSLTLTKPLVLYLAADRGS